MKLKITYKQAKPETFKNVKDIFPHYDGERIYLSIYYWSDDNENLINRWVEYFIIKKIHLTKETELDKIPFQYTKKYLEVLAVMTNHIIKANFKY